MQWEKNIIEEILESAMTDKDRVFAIFEKGYTEWLYQAKNWADSDVIEVIELDKQDNIKDDRPVSWWVWLNTYKETWSGYSFPSQYNDYTLREFRKTMVKVMMVAVAAILWVDRKLTYNK